MLNKFILLIFIDLLHIYINMKSYPSFQKYKAKKRPYPYYNENNLENLKTNIFKKQLKKSNDYLVDLILNIKLKDDNIETESYSLNSNNSFYSSINIISETESDNNIEYYIIDESNILNLINYENISKYNMEKNLIKIKNIIVIIIILKLVLRVIIKNNHIMMRI